MIIAIMQPYLFPYIGYYQLIKSSDIFVFYDDVNYIKNGWIDRNRILSNGAPIYFKAPLLRSSSFKKINETELNKDEYNKWRIKFIKTLEIAYKKAPFYSNAMNLVCGILDDKYEFISELSINSIRKTVKYMEFNSEFKKSSEDYKQDNLQRDDRLIHICHTESATTYINMEGGSHLYAKEYFNQRHIDIQFLKPNIEPYKQFKNDFVGGLSIIDILMFNSIDTIKSKYL